MAIAVANYCSVTLLFISTLIYLFTFPNDSFTEWIHESIITPSNLNLIPWDSL